MRGATLRNAHRDVGAMPIPYYRDETVTLYCGDCRDVLPMMASASVDLVLTDPPYGIGRATWDVPVRWEDEAARLVKPGGYVVAFGLLRTLATVCLYLEASGLELEQEMVWVRGVLGATGDRFGRSHELWLACYKAPRRPPRVDRVRVPYAPTSTATPSHRRHPLGATPGSVWYVHETSGAAAAHTHETEKPRPLFERIVLALSDPGDLVLDPFCGSGTTLRAAQELGRRAIGITDRQRDCNDAVERLAQYVLPLWPAAGGVGAPDHPNE